MDTSRSTLQLSDCGPHVVNIIQFGVIATSNGVPAGLVATEYPPLNEGLTPKHAGSASSGTKMASQRYPKDSIKIYQRLAPPYTMRELRTMYATGGVLNKRAWWIKWTTRPEVRAKWLLEIEQTQVESMVSHLWVEWPNRRNLWHCHENDALLEVTTMADEMGKAAAIERVVAEVMYPASYQRFEMFDEGAHYESNDEERKEAEAEWRSLIEPEDESKKNAGDDTNDIQTESDEEEEEEEENFFDGEGYMASAINTHFEGVFDFQKTMHAEAQLTWYVAMAILRDELRRLQPTEWTSERINELTYRIWSEEDDEVTNRTTELILAVVREGPCTLEVLHKHLPGETRKNQLKLLQYHFTKIRIVLKNTMASIVTTLDESAERLVTQAKSEHDTNSVRPAATPGPAPGTFLSDDCVPTSLKSKFLAQIAALENVPDEDKDWHPNSNDQVLDLVHPSLFCGIVDKTKLLAESEAENLYSDAAAHMRAIMFAPTPRTLPQFEYGIAYQWLPCEIDVAENGESSTIRTYINNLHPEDHAPLYDSIAAIFTRFVPLFDRVLAPLVELSGNDTKIEEGDSSTTTISTSTTYSLKGSRCQVIVKIAEIVLTPENPEYEGGSWHMEGTDAEAIVATGLYYFGCENITESRLAFCTLVEKPRHDQNDNMGVWISYGLKKHELLTQTLGSVTAMEDRCLAFPNSLHHQVQPFELEDPAKPGVRKILAFFLVDPSRDPIPSTAIVPPQQEAWASRALEPTLKKLRVPDIVVEKIQGMAGDRMSLEEAYEVRLKLMEERSANNLEEKDDDDYIFNLCEH